METIRFVVERITYQNPENGYSVLKVNMKDYRDLVTVVGTFGDLFVGAVLLCEGYWTEDKKYGRQFKSMKWEEVLPATAYGIEKYLGSGMIRGIGPKFASRIVQKFGTDTIDIIDNQPEKLLEIPGIGKERLRRIRESWEQQKEIKNIMIFLQNYGVSTAFATKIFKTYGNDSIRVVRDSAVVEHIKEVKVEKPLSWSQKAKIGAFPWLLLALIGAALWIFRKYLF